MLFAMIFIVSYFVVLGYHLSRVFRFLGINFLAASSLALIKWWYVAVTIKFVVVMVGALTLMLFGCDFLIWLSIAISGRNSYCYCVEFCPELLIDY